MEVLDQIFEFFQWPEPHNFLVWCQSFGGAMEALSRKTEQEKLVELEEMLADATTLTGV